MTGVRFIRIAIALLSAAALLLFLASFRTDTQGRLSDFMLSKADYEAVKQARNNTRMDGTAELLLNSAPTFFDEVNGKIYYSYIDGKKYLDPVVKLLSVDKDLRVAVLKSDFSAEDISKNIGVMLILYNSSEFAEYELIFTGMPIISIQVEDEPDGVIMVSQAGETDGAVLEADDALGDTDAVDVNADEPIGELYVSGSLTAYNNGRGVSQQQRLVTSDASFRIRGGTSRLYDKKSYRVELHITSIGGNKRNNDISLLGMRQDDDWAMSAVYNDPEKSRLLLSSNLWWDMEAQTSARGSVFATQAAFAEVLINNEYRGIYVLRSMFDDKQMGLNDTGNMYTSDFAYRSFSYDETDSEVFHISGSTQTAGKYEIRFPSKTFYNSYLKWRPLDEFLQLTDSDDAYFAEQYPLSVNIDNAINAWLIYNLSAAQDANANNLFYIAERINGVYVISFAAWDLDQTWGNIWVGNESPVFTDIVLSPEDTFEYPEFGVERGIKCNAGDMRERVYARYKALRGGLLSENGLNARLNDYEELVFGSGAYLRDAERWPLSPSAENMEGLRSFINKRIKYMDALIAELMEQ